MGVPGRIVRPVDAALTQRIADTWAHYVEQARAHRAGRYPLTQRQGRQDSLGVCAEYGAVGPVPREMSVSPLPAAIIHLIHNPAPG